MTIPAIIDCDPGHDDAMAILLGARVLDLKAITTVHGNVPLSLTTLNARKVVELAGLTNIPIAAGMDRPLVRQVVHAPEVHGQTGLDGPELPEPTVEIRQEHAVDYLYCTAKAVDNFHLIPIGPLTNVAVALRRYPDFAGSVKQISLMGGSLTFGNSTAAAEFNIWADPDAAHVVFESGIPIKMVGLNVTRQVAATPAHRDKIRSIGNRTARVVADLLDYYSGRLAELFGLPGGSMHDPLAVAALVDPDVLRFEPMHVVVELRGEHTYGMTLCDYRHHRLDGMEGGSDRPSRGQEPNAEVAIAVDQDRFWELFYDALSTYP
ncbi:MAG TPA: nucleoside hydrolase [Candidatus Binatia bacterium]|nr:nucleoside hydrolase [Candidatus Binatia bacterium]